MVPRPPAVPSSCAGRADCGRRAGRASFRWAAWCRDCGSPSLGEKRQGVSRSLCWGGWGGASDILCTYAGLQVGAVADVREAQHLLPPPAATFDPSICRGGGGGWEREKKRVRRSGSSFERLDKVERERAAAVDTPSVKRGCARRARHRCVA